MITGLVYDPLFLEHDPGAGHPECKERLSAILTHLQAQPWFETLRRLPARAVDGALLETVHDDGYIRRAEQACLAGHPYLDTMDVGISRDSYAAARLAAGAPLALADAIMARELN